MLKNAIILGDSYSTFKNYIPDGYAYYYSENSRPETDVSKVSETWWYQVVTEANLNLVLNDSWSGSTIGYTGYNNTDCSQTSSFIHRLNSLIKDDYFTKNEIDTVFVFGGTNDNWANAPLGTIKHDGYKNDDLYFVLPAIDYLFKTLKKALPKANIYCLINTELKPELVDGFEQVCEKYNITKIAFNNIDKRSGHPTIQGMQNIKKQVLSVLHT